MAKDYFHDIVPPGSSNRETHVHIDAETPPQESRRSHEDERTIRNVVIPQRTKTIYEQREIIGAPRSSGTSQILGWITLTFLLVVVAGVAGYLALRTTTVTVSPRVHTVLLDSTTLFSAYPNAVAATGTLAYTVLSFDTDESAIIPTQGVQHKEIAASGEVILHNEYSSSPFTLVKNSRLKAPSGLIYRIPADVVIPGKKGTKPGIIQVTIVADQVGPDYNVSSSTRFVLPGLSSNPLRYRQVYATLSSPIGGGFSGDEQIVVPAVVATAENDMRGRIQQFVRSRLENVASGTVAFYDLTHIQYAEVPRETLDGGNVRLAVHAHVDAPVFSEADFAQAVANAAGVQTDGSPLSFIPGTDFALKEDSGTDSLLSTTSLAFTGSGAINLVWNIDTSALASALAGLDAAAFQNVITKFPQIEKAHARVEPLWNQKFPQDPRSIEVKIELPVKP